MSAGRKLPGTPRPGHLWNGSDGVQIAGDVWGDPGRPLVMLLHGGGQTRHAWKRTGVRLAQAGLRAIAFDARGHGDSDWAPDGRYDQDSMILDLQCVIEASGDPGPVLVGASMGGNTAMVAVGEGRVEAKAVVLVDVAPRVETEGVNRIHAFMGQRPQGFGSLEEVADAISAYQPHRPRAKSLQGLAKNVRVAEDGRFRWHWDPRFRLSAEAPQKRRQRLEEAARKLAVPTLLVRGGLSDVLTDAGVKEFMELCPHAEYVEVTNAAHMVAADRNDPFGDAIIEFVSRSVTSLDTGRRT